MAKGSDGTPLMKQYYGIKAKYPDALLLFRVGDFYETFGDDAIKASKVLGIVLTKRSNGAASDMELAGFPYHSLDTYLPKLVRAGLRVAVCDQLEDPKATKTIVKRGVTELVTPGITYSDKILDHKTNNFLAALHIGAKKTGVAFVDVSTGEFMVAEGSTDYINKLLNSLKPGEVIFEKKHRAQFANLFPGGFYTYTLDDWVFMPDFANENLLKHFGTKSLKGFGVEQLTEGIVAAGAILHYLNQNHQERVGHITALQRIDEGNYVWLDGFTIRNLELWYSTNPNATTLLDVIDETLTPMGSRLLKRWIAMPLIDLAAINARLDIVSFLQHNTDTAAALTNVLSQMGDLERLITKVATFRISPRELVAFKNSLLQTAQVKQILGNSNNAALQALSNKLNALPELVEQLEKKLNPDAPAMVNKGNVINTGVNADLDTLRSIAFGGKDYLLNLQRTEAERTGIGSLKIAFNNVFGYYLEVTNAHKDKVPQSWIRKQTLVNAERYITPELKEYEEKILGAEDKILALETNLYNALVESCVPFVETVQHTAQLIAQADCLQSFATVSTKNNYTRPVLDDSTVLDIRNARHPVIETLMPIGEAYVANDIYLDTKSQQIIIITGPNMSGKSALLRQTALIVLMAQMGCFVPAETAHIGIVDKVFTRVGASDNLSSGESTFMVEMNETAGILNNVTPRSLVLLDEIGRGTSTYDGISIAWAIAEYLHENPQTAAKTLFATHYHELNDMAELFNRIKNYNVAVKEADGKVHFLRKLTPGGSNHSFGIYVAKMAGMPRKVVGRADEILKHLEQTHAQTGGKNPQPKVKDADKGMQLSFFQLDDPVLEQIRDEIMGITIDTLTPVEALMKLNDIKKLLGK